MIVRTTEEITGTERDVAAKDWRSKRIILAGDGVGFSFHETTINAGSVSEFHYRHHVEAVWVVEGSGTLTNHETGDEHPLRPGTMYLLDGHERHRVTCDTAAAHAVRVQSAGDRAGGSRRDGHLSAGGADQMSPNVTDIPRDNYPTRLDHPQRPDRANRAHGVGSGCRTVHCDDGRARDGRHERISGPQHADVWARIGWCRWPTNSTGSVPTPADDDPRIIREPHGRSIRSVFRAALFSDMIAEVIRLDTVLPVARQLLGSDVYLHQARINMMPGFTGTGFYWHSDFETWHAEDGMPSMRAVSCSIALTENYPVQRLV